MNIYEKALIAACLVLVIGGAALRVSHRVSDSSARTMTTIGYMLGLSAYSRYTSRLKAENRDLEAELRQLRGQ